MKNNFLGNEEKQYLQHTLSEAIKKDNGPRNNMSRYCILFPENHYLGEATAPGATASAPPSSTGSAKPADPSKSTKTGFGGVKGGGGMGAPSKSKKDSSIMFGATEADDLKKALGMYAAGGLLSMFGPGLGGAVSQFGKNLAGKFGESLGGAFMGTLMGQLKTISGYDFVNQELSQIGARNISDIMQGSGKKSFSIPKSPKNMPLNPEDATSSGTGSARSRTP